MSKKVLILLCLLNSVLLSAQDTTLSIDRILQMSIEELLNVPVSGASIYDQNIQTVPGYVLIVNSDDIRNRGYNDLSDVMRDVLGVDIIDNARGFGEYYFIHGIGGNDRFLVLLDGHKINPPSGTFLSVGNSISIRYARRIEIIYGPVSVIYGSEALSGVINIVSMDGDTKGFDGHARLSYGGRNTFDEELGFNYANANGFKFGLNARFFISDGPDLADRDTVYNIISGYSPPQVNRFEQPIKDHTIHLNTSYKNFHAMYFRQNFNEGNALGTDPKGNIYNKEYKWHSVNEHLVFGYENQFNNSSELRVDLAFIHFKIDPETQFYKWKNSYATDSAFSQYMTGDDKSARLKVSYNRQIRDKLIFLVGLENEYLKSIPPYANDQVLGNSLKFEGENANIIKRELKINEYRIAGFLQLSYKLFDKVNAIAGIRYSYSSLNEEALTPRLGMIYSPNGNIHFKYVYGTGFQAPSMFYKYEQWGAEKNVMLSEEEVRRLYPQWSLTNQKLETHDISFSWKIGKKVLVNMSFFSNQFDDVIERVTFSDSVYNKYYSSDDTSVYSRGIRNENIGYQYTYGANLNLNFNVNNNFSFYFSYSYLDGYSQLKAVKSDLSGIANHKFWMGVNARNLVKNLNLSLRFKQSGRINNSNLFYYPQGKQPGYANLDFYADYRHLFDRVTIYLNITNVLDQDYRHAGLYRQSGGYLPAIEQDLRMFKLGIELLF